MRQSFRVKINLFLLVLALIFFAPVRFAQASGLSSAQILVEDPCLVVRDCCAKMAACCCEVQPVKPVPPADLACAPMLSPTDKFIATKDGGKFIAQNLPTVLQRPAVFAYHGYRLTAAPSCSTPLYILNRALLL